MESSLREALAEIKRPGSFVVRREAPASALHLEVRGVGPVKFPISSTKARAICGLALLARHGFKDQTLLDATVRNTWEVSRARIKVDQRLWNKTLVPELDRIRQDLGLPPSCKLRAELHNLLVYAPGQFFVPHQDSEKGDGMIGTLVVTLPSKFSGGALIVKHHDEKREFRGAGNKLDLVAFYADCHHEVRSVSDGYRVVLTYNLLLSNTDEVGPLPVSDQKLAQLKKRVSEFFDAPAPARWPGAKREPPPDRLVYLLDHQYSQASLSWSHLKNADGVRAAALREVAKQLDCDVGLALADVRETWSCEEEEYGYSQSWRRRRRYDDGDDAYDRGHDGTPELVELNDSEVELRHFIDAQGTAGAVSGHVTESELCYTTPSVDLDPFQSEHEGYMGNWGNTVERWYHRAAVVLWPRKRSFIIRAKTSAKLAIEELASTISLEGLEVARLRAEELVPFWAQVWRESSDSRLVAKAMHVALVLDSPQLARSLILPMRIENLSSRDASVLVALLDRYGFEWLEQALTEWRSRREQANPEERLLWISSIPTLVRALMAPASAPAQKLARTLVGEQWAWLADRHRSALGGRPIRTQEALATLAIPALRLFESCLPSGREDVHDQMRRFLSSPEYPALALAKLLEAARRTYEARELDALDLDALQSHCASKLETLLATPRRANDDWAIAPPGRCSCELCAELSRFLVAKSRTTLEWPLAKDRRAHVHGILDGDDLPVTHTTRREGSPYTLVLTKTSALFEREAAQRAAWKLGLDRLRNGRTTRGSADSAPMGRRRGTRKEQARHARR